MKQPLSLTDEYLNFLTDQDRFMIHDFAHKLLISKPRMDTDNITDAWIEAAVQVFLQKGLLRPINLIKLELAK